MNLAALFLTFSAAYGLPPGLLGSVCWVESGWRPGVVHRDDGRGSSLGLCQIKLSTAQWMGFKGSADELMNPETNIQYAAKYLAYQLKRYRSLARGVSAYNGGSSHGDGKTVYFRKVFARWDRTANQGWLAYAGNGN